MTIAYEATVALDKPWTVIEVCFAEDPEAANQGIIKELFDEDPDDWDFSDRRVEFHAELILVPNPRDPNGVSVWVPLAPPPIVHMWHLTEEALELLLYGGQTFVSQVLSLPFNESTEMPYTEAQELEKRGLL